MFLLKSDLFLNTKYFEGLLKLNITMQGKLRLKAHKLWSHLVVSFRKLPQIVFLPRFAATLPPGQTCTCPALARPSMLRNPQPRRRHHTLRMAIGIEMHVSHVNFKKHLRKIFSHKQDVTWC